MKTIAMVAACACLALPSFAQSDDFQREGKPEQRQKKDPLEGKAPPPCRGRSG